MMPRGSGRKKKKKAGALGEQQRELTGRDEVRLVKNWAEHWKGIAKELRERMGRLQKRPRDKNSETMVGREVKKRRKGAGKGGGENVVNMKDRKNLTSKHAPKKNKLNNGMWGKEVGMGGGSGVLHIRRGRKWFGLFGGKWARKPYAQGTMWGPAEWSGGSPRKGEFCRAEGKRRGQPSV